MAENENHSDDRAELASEDGGYEIDLDRHSAGDLDAAIQEAIEAVDRGSSGETGAVDAAADGELSVEDQLKERLLRTLADFDNYRKRAEREKQTLRRMGTFDVLKDSLAVMDNLERALGSGGGVEDLKQGLRLILRQYEEFLRRHGVERIDADGQVFDPTIHEAVARQESPEVEEPTVIGEFQKGYLFHDRLLRPAMVHVAMPVAAAVAEEPRARAQEPQAAPERAGGRQPELRTNDEEVEEAVD